MKLSIKLKVIILLVLFSISAFARVINAGVGGNNTVNLLKRIEEDVLKKNPDLTILMVGTNDMLNSRKMISFQDYADNLNIIVKTLLSNEIKVLLMSPPPVDSNYPFCDMTKVYLNSLQMRKWIL